MKRARTTFPGTSEGGPPADLLPRGSGAVLRGVAMRLEPRTLLRPGAGLSLRSTPAPAPGNAAPPEESALYRQGYGAGRADADAARKAEAEDEFRRNCEAGLELGLQEGRKQGLAEGREVGRQSAEKEARAAVEAAVARLARLDELLSALPAALARRLEAAEDDMVALCHAVVCRILGVELVAREGVAQAVRQAVREAAGGSTPVGSRAPLAIHLHPLDLESLRGDEQLAAWLDETQAGPGGVRWVADERVRAGGCMVCSDEGSLDARLETQMAALRDVLLQGRENAGPCAPAASAAGEMAPSPACAPPGHVAVPEDSRGRSSGGA